MKQKKLDLYFLFFLFYASAGAIEPVLNLIFREKGIPLERISVLSLIPRLMMLLATPLWAGAADLLHLHRYILPATMLLSIPFAIGVYVTAGFVPLLLVLVLFSFNFAPIRSLCDSTAVTVLGDKSRDYGKIRAWGGVGYGLAAISVGFLAERYDTGIALILLTIMFIFGIFISFRLKVTPKVATISIKQLFQDILSDPKWRLFLFGSFFAGISINLIINYLSIFLNDMGASSTMIGIALSGASFSAIPFFFLSPLILRKWKPVKVMQLAMLILAVRCFFYTQINSALPAIFIQLMHGLSFSLFWSAGVLYAKQLTVEGYDATSQALFTATYFGLGGVTSGLVGGLIFARLGADMMFSLGIVTALMAFFLFTLLNKNHQGIVNS